MKRRDFSKTSPPEVELPIAVYHTRDEPLTLEIHFEAPLVLHYTHRRNVNSDHLRIVRSCLRQAKGEPGIYIISFDQGRIRLCRRHSTPSTSAVSSLCVPHELSCVGGYHSQDYMRKANSPGLFSLVQRSSDWITPPAVNLSLPWAPKLIKTTITLGADESGVTISSAIHHTYDFSPSDTCLVRNAQSKERRTISPLRSPSTDAWST